MTETLSGTTDPYRAIAQEADVALTTAAHYVTTYGLYKGYFTNPYGTYRLGRALDARGAINLVVNGDAEECGRPGGEADQVTLTLLDHLGLLEKVGGIDPDDQQGMITILSEWSDHPERTKADVADAMTECAAKLHAAAQS